MKKNFARTNVVSLHIGALRWEGWTDIRILRSMENAAGEFTLAVTERFPGQIQPIRIRPGDACRVKIGEDLVVTGHVEDLRPVYDARQHSVTLSGRSLTADLVDCSAKVGMGQIWKVKLERIVEYLVEPYKVKVRAEVDTGTSLRDFQIHPGETVFAAIDRLARTRALLVTDDPTGALVLTRAGSRRVKGRLKLGENILAGHGTFSHRQRYSEYVVKGQRAADDAIDDVDEFAGPEGKACDTEIGRFRELILVNDTPGDRFEHRRRAEWEAARRAGLSLNVNYTVQGWRDPSGALWEPNMLVSVIDEWLGIERDLLIVSTEFTLSSGGSKTEMELAPKEAYEPLPEVPEAANKGFAIASSAANAAVARRLNQRRS